MKNQAFLFFKLDFSKFKYRSTGGLIGCSITIEIMRYVEIKQIAMKLVNLQKLDDFTYCEEYLIANNFLCGMFMFVDRVFLQVLQN